EMQADGMLPGVSSPLVSSSTQTSEAAKPATYTAPVPEVVRESPLTEVQMEVWLSAQLGDEASCAYNEPLTLHLHGSLNEPALRQAVQELIDRHDALRSAFTPTGDRQRFSPELTVEMPLIDLSPLDRTQCESRLKELKDTEAKTPFDLVNGPVARFHL